VNRLEQKSGLLIKLGTLLGPLLRLVDAPDEYNQQEKAETLARYFAEYDKLIEAFRAFCTGQPRHNYSLEFHKLRDALLSVHSQLMNGETLERILPKIIASAQAAIDDVPVPPTSVVLEAGSPFTAYCRLRELCEADATLSLVWLDPYMDASIFQRYVGGVRSTVPVTLVTTEPGAHASTRDAARWNEFLDISRLYASERGASLYTLVVQANLHDRWVVFDDKRIYALGGSAKDAAQKDYFTIASIEATSTNLKTIKVQISGGTEFFGRNSPVHR
jgi:hypothetical protein